MPRHNAQWRPLGFVAGYIVCFWLIRLIILTLVTFTFIRSDAMSSSSLQRIGDAARANQVLTYGFSALFFVVILELMQPLTRTRIKQVFDLTQLKRISGASGLGGFILGLVLIAGSTLGGHMSFLGFFMRFDEVVVSIASGALFAGALLVLVLVEEYLFRKVLEPFLDDHFGPLVSVAVSCIVYVGIKASQFDFGQGTSWWITAANLLLMNINLSGIARNERTPLASGAFLATYLVLVHILFGLPFMGQDMPAIFLLRGSSDEGLGQILSGGLQGPEAGLVQTVLLVIYLYMPQIRSKKIEV
jgi:membrane protease YdiL (CAAX protease family)